MKKQLLLISGISGAGKTTASNILEDMGYRCLDQFFSELLKDLIDLLENADSPRYERIAITISLDELSQYLNYLHNSDIDVRIILLDASFNTVINRYKFSRRVHPLLISNKVNTLEEAVLYEKELLEQYRKDNITIIDTTDLSVKGLKEVLDRILKYDEYLNFSLSFVSFGYKNGLPHDADLVFDVRFLDNPFYDPDLRSLTGNDPRVVDFIMSKAKTQDFLKALTAFLDQVIKDYHNEDKRHLTIAIGCTGGQHRSVAITNYLYDHYQKQYLCYKAHRELKETA